MVKILESAPIRRNKTPKGLESINIKEQAFGLASRNMSSLKMIRTRRCSPHRQSPSDVKNQLDISQTPLSTFRDSHNMDKHTNSHTHRLLSSSVLSPVSLDTTPSGCLTTQTSFLLGRRSQVNPPCHVSYRPRTYLLPSHLTSVSVARVKKIIATDPDIGICSNNAAFVITLATASCSPSPATSPSQFSLTGPDRRCSSSTSPTRARTRPSWTANPAATSSTRIWVSSYRLSRSCMLLAPLATSKI